jgi:DNA helicase-2/ATP-dependent DNA helicase PcrA
VSPSGRRQRSGRVVDDAPVEVGTRLEDAEPNADGAAPAEPDWLREAPTAAERPEELSPEERRDRERAQAEQREARAAVRAKEIVGRLNPEQARAVTTTDGPLLILAGAGSGKTRVLAHRIAYLVGVQDVRPWSILAVTFTNRAAGELRDRIISLVGEPGRDVQAGTFHSLCARVLRRDGEAIGISRRFVVYDTEDQQSLMKQLLREEDLPLTGEFRPSAVLGAISRAKNEMLDAEFLRQNAANLHERTIAKLAVRYEERLRKVGALDFDDLLLEAVRPVRRGAEGARPVPGSLALPPRRRVPGHEPAAIPLDQGARREAPQPRGRRRRRPVDLPLARRRHPQHPRLRARLPDATVVKLERNYRSTQLILDAAHAVVSRNTERTDKKLWTDRAAAR